MYLIFLIFPLYLNFLTNFFFTFSLSSFYFYFILFYFFFNNRVNFFYQINNFFFLKKILQIKLKFKQLIITLPFFNYYWKPLFKRTSYYGLLKSKNNS